MRRFSKTRPGVRVCWLIVAGSRSRPTRRSTRPSRAIVTATVDALALTLAWLYVAGRVAHSVVHLTYNNVLHRLTAFGASNLALLALWALLVVRLI